MIIGFTTVFAIAAGILLGSLLLAAAGLLLARAARRQARAAHAVADITSLRLAEVEAALADCSARLEALLTERERERAAPARPSLREAVALSRHGASTEELVATCRIGQGEARLIQMLHGASRQPDAGTH